MKPSASRSCKDKKLLSLLPEVDPKKPLLLSGDSEDDSKGRTYMVNFFDGKHHYTFRSTAAAVEWLIEISRYHRKGVEVWFANLGYDLGNVFRDSQEFLSMNMSGGRVITAKVFQERVKLKDILNVIPGTSVKGLGKMIGLEKLDSGKDFDNEVYCQRDTEIVFWSKLKFEAALSQINVSLKNTAASTGFTALLQQYSRLSVNNLKDEDHQFMQAGYYGGRVEVFYTNKIKKDRKNAIHGYDIVSCYPTSMLDVPLVDTKSKIYTRNPQLDRRNGMADVVVKSPSRINLPYLPCRRDGKLIFPTGTFRGTWTYFELREAKKLGYEILHTYKAVEFKSEYDFVMDEFVRKIFAIRAEAKRSGNTVLSYACKIILNGSYGKFAMGNEKTELVAFEEFHKIKGNFTSEVFPNNQILIKKETNFAPSTNFFTASMITAKGRHALYEHLLRASEGERFPLYCDTDGIIFFGRDEGFAVGKKGELGSLGKEYEAKEAHFLLPKTYMLKTTDGREIYKCKGVKNELAKKFFTEGFAESMQPLKYVETCRKNLFISERNKKKKKGEPKEPLIPFNLWVKKPKRLKSRYDKRVKTHSGKTRPIKLNYDLEKEDYVN